VGISLAIEILDTVLSDDLTIGPNDNQMCVCHDWLDLNYRHSVDTCSCKLFFLSQ
jgi:hypothetical protein